jgi:hypothetical protein
MVKIIKGTESDILSYIKQYQKKIYVWGVGVMFQVCFGDLLFRNGMIGQVVGCIDSDSGKIGKYVQIGDKKISIISFEQMIESVSGDRSVVIVVACSYYYEILGKLDGEKNLDGIDCILLPMVYLENLDLDANGNLDVYKKHHHKIPRVIHYCWFGKGKLSEENIRCIESWKKMCPGYEIKRWDESNIDINISPWMKKAYEDRQWAYVSDYARAWILYNFGGYYFDVDVELIKNLDTLSELEAFSSFEKWPVISTGGGCGSLERFWLWKEIMDLKDNVCEKQVVGIIPKASGYYDTVPLIKHGMKLNGGLQCVDGFVSLPFEYFQPFDYVTKKILVTKNTYGIHHFNWSWADNSMNDGNPQGLSYYSMSLERAVCV